MKVLYILAVTALIGCSADKSEIELESDSENKYESVDSILKRSQQNLATAHKVSAVGDSTITKRVQVTAKKLVVLKQENKQLKVENHELKAEINDLNASSKPYKLLPISNDQDH